MRLTTKGRFAVAAMVDVALYQRAGPVSLASLRERHAASMSLLESIFARLRRHALVTSTRGAEGGYRLARRAEGISIAEILRAVDVGDEARASSPKSADSTQHIESFLSDRLSEVLASLSLQKLVEQHAEKCAPGLTPRASLHRSGLRRKPVNVVAGVPNSVFALGSVAAHT